jgi:hypothetical protein
MSKSLRESLTAHLPCPGIGFGRKPLVALGPPRRIIGSYEPTSSRKNKVLEEVATSA